MCAQHSHQLLGRRYQVLYPLGNLLRDDVRECVNASSSPSSFGVHFTGSARVGVNGGNSDTMTPDNDNRP
jgi:hypothetical protein